MKDDKRGITLIALVITIVVLIILATVAINLSLGENGIFKRAKQAKEQYSNAQSHENDQVNELDNKINGLVNSNTKQKGLKKRYVIGDLVTLGEGINEERFYAIENSDESQSKVKLITEKCVETINYKQVDDANEVPWGSSYVYKTSSVKSHVDNYAINLQSRVGSILEDMEITTSVSSGTQCKARLLYEEEINVLYNNETVGQNILFGTTKKLNYWSGKEYGGTGRPYWVSGNNNCSILVSYDRVGDEYVRSLRPVIEVLKTNI